MKLSKENTGNCQSQIQVLANLITAKNQFFESLNNLVEGWDIKDNIFGSNGTQLVEMDHGYAGELKTADKLLDLYDEFNVLENCIRVKDGKFTLCKWHARLSDVNEDVVIDLKKSMVINA